MTDDDVNAIATYLKSLPGDGKAQTAMAASTPEMTAGGAIYRDQCSACHGLDGKGIDRLFPSVANSSMARADDPTSVIRIVLRGARSVATDKEPTAPGMPSYGWQLNDGQVANVLTYIRNSWGNAAPAVSTDDVRRLRKSVAKRSD
jgi:mono/diheme cytochrome c family protein